MHRPRPAGRPCRARRLGAGPLVSMPAAAKEGEGQQQRACPGGCWHGAGRGGWRCCVVLALGHAVAHARNLQRGRCVRVRASAPPPICCAAAAISQQNRTTASHQPDNSHQPTPVRRPCPRGVCAHADGGGPAGVWNGPRGAGRDAQAPQGLPLVRVPNPARVAVRLPVACVCCVPALAAPHSLNPLPLRPQVRDHAHPHARAVRRG